MVFGAPLINLFSMGLQNTLPILLYTLSYNDLPVIFTIFILINVSIFGIRYLIEHIFPTPNGQTWILNEKNELLRTVVIVASFLAIAYFLSVATDGIIQYASGGIIPAGQINPMISYGIKNEWYSEHIALAFYSVKSMLLQLRSIYLNYFEFEFVVGFLSTLSIPVTPTIHTGFAMVSFSTIPFEGLALIAQAHTAIVDMVTYLIAFIYGKLYIILFSWKTVPFILIPLGIILRSVEFTRKTGSTIIAISLVLYFVFPLMALFSDYLIYDVYKPKVYISPISHLGMIKGSTDSSTNNPLTRLSELMKEENDKYQQKEKQYRDNLKKAIENKAKKRNVVFQWLYDHLKNYPTIRNLLFGTIDVVKSAPGVIIDFFKGLAKFGANIWYLIFGGHYKSVSGWLNALTPKFYGDVMYPYLIGEVVQMSQFAILVLFTSVLEVIVSVNAYTSIADIIGGEPKILGLQRLV